MLLVVACAVVLVAAACSGDDDDDDLVDDASTVEEISTTTTTEVETAELDLVAGCADASTTLATLQAALPDATTSTAALQRLEANVEVFEDWADVAPEEIDDEMEVLAEAYARVVDAAAEGRFNPDSGSEPPEDMSDAIELLGSEEVVTSADLVAAWFDAGCQPA